MKKIISLFLALALLCALAGCTHLPGTPGAPEVPEALEGSWRSESEDISISGTRVEFKGYYELEGHRMAGVVEEGRLEMNPDGSFTVQVGSITREGYLREDGILVMDGNEYYR